MSRKLTTYKRPSILAQIQAAPDVDTLNVQRIIITNALRTNAVGSQEFAPDEATVRQWAKAQWDAAIRLLLTAPTGGQLCYAYNVMRTWPMLDIVATQLRIAFELRAKQLPSDAEALLAQGIEIEGITKLPHEKV